MGRISLGAAMSLVALVLLAVAGPQLVRTNWPGTAARVAPRQLVAVAQEAGQATGVDAGVLLAISKVECKFGQCRSGLPDTLVPADLRSHVDQSALQPGGATATLLGIQEGRRIGDWVNPVPVVGGQHAMGFMQFLPSTWREEAPLAPGHPTDPYRPRDSMVVAGSYLARLQSGAVDGQRHDLHDALTVYGGSADYAGRVLALAG